MRDAREVLRHQRTDQKGDDAARRMHHDVVTPAHQRGNKAAAHRRIQPGEHTVLNEFSTQRRQRQNAKAHTGRHTQHSGRHPAHGIAAQAFE